MNSRKQKQRDEKPRRQKGTHARSQGTSSPNHPAQHPTPHVHVQTPSSPASDSRFAAYLPVLLPLDSYSALRHFAHGLHDVRRVSLLHGSLRACPLRAQSRMVSRTGRTRRGLCSGFPLGGVIACAGLGRMRLTRVVLQKSNS